MGKIEDTIMSFGGHQYRSCYKDLYQAVRVGKELQPDPPQMKVIVAEVCQREKKKSLRSVWRALARAVEDLWDSGDKAALSAYYHSWERYRPKPQEFILIVSRRIWDEEAHNG